MDLLHLWIGQKWTVDTNKQEVKHQFDHKINKLIQDSRPPNSAGIVSDNANDWLALLLCDCIEVFNSFQIVSHQINKRNIQFNLGSAYVWALVPKWSCF